MDQDRICRNCDVEVSSDLCNCPLCGRHIGNHLYKSEVNNKSFPVYSFKHIKTARWYNIIRASFWLVGIICTIVNLMFRTEALWFPYVLAALVMVFHVFIEPIKVNVSSYIKNLTIMSILLAIFTIFIDAYNQYAFNVNFGWSVSYTAPIIMTVGILASTIICLSTKIYEVDLLRRITFLAVLSVLYFVVKIVWFKELVVWPSLMFMCTSLGLVVLLELFKRNKLIKELSKEFHL